MLVGRETELARLDALVGSARGSRGGALLLSGEPGIGKTALLEAAVRRADGFRVLRATGRLAERGLSFAALSDLLRPVADLVGRLPEPQAVALRAALAIGPPLPGDRDRFTAFIAALGVLEVAAEAAPVLIAVDDLNTIDSESAEALMFCARRLAADPVAMLLTAREGERLPAEVGELEVLRLEGLTPDAARELIRRSGRGIAPGVGSRVVAAAAGNPLGLLEIPAALSDEQLDGRAALPEPLVLGGGRAERLFLRRVTGLPARGRRALVVAAASRSGELTTLTAALGRHGLEIGDLAGAEGERLVSIAGGRVEFHHPLVRAAVHSAADPAERRAAHRALADALDGEAAREERAWHLAHAIAGPDEAVAAELEATGSEARARGAYASAADLLTVAADASPDRAQTGRRLTAAADAAILGQRLEEAAALAGQAAALLPEGSPGWGAAQRLRAVAQEGLARSDEAIAIAEGAAALVRDRDPTLAGALLADAALYSLDLGDADGAADRARRALELAGPDDEDASVVAWAALGVADVQGGRDADLMDAIGRAAALQARGSISPFLFASMTVAIQGLVWQGRLDRARAVLEPALAVARRAGAPNAISYPLAILSDIELRSGRLAHATAAAAEAATIAEEAGLLGVLQHAHACLARAHAWRGDGAACRAEVAAVAALGVGPPDSGADYSGWALGLLLLGAGENEAAVRTLIPVVARARVTGRRNPAVIPALPDLCEALVLLGRDGDARELADELSGAAAAGGGPWALAAAARCRGMLPGADIDRELALAEAEHARAGGSHELARTRLALGRTLLERERPEEGATLLESARRGLESAGARGFAERARDALATPGAGPAPGPAPAARLTPQELQVALLVADGRSNREVADALFVTRRTVEFHLTNLYRKLGVRNRAGLAAHVARNPIA